MKRSKIPCFYLKHGSYYYVSRINGKQKWHNLGRHRAQALAEYGRLTSGVVSENAVAKLVQTTIDQMAKDLKPNTVKQYRGCESQIAKAFEAFEVGQVKPKHIAQFMQHHADKPNMANRMLSVLRMSFDRGVILGMADHNPCAPIKRHKEAKRDRLMTNGEFKALMKYPNDTLKCVLELCYLTAQRVGDVLKISLQDITAEGIYFKQQKTGKQLLVQMSPDLQKAIERAKSIHPGISPIYLLGLRNGRVRGYCGVRDLFNRAKKAAGISGVTLHDIRAKSLTDADKQGLNAQALAGHSTAQQTDSYLRDKSAVVVQGVGNLVR